MIYTYANYENIVEDSISFLNTTQLYIQNRSYCTWLTFSFSLLYEIQI